MMSLPVWPVSLSKGGSLSRGLCPEGSLSRGALSGGSLSEGGSLSWGETLPWYSEERTVHILLESILVQNNDGVVDTRR